MQMYKEFNNVKYYFWAVISVFMQVNFYTIATIKVPTKIEMLNLAKGH